MSQPQHLQYETAARVAWNEIAILNHAENNILQRLARVRSWKQQKLSQLTNLMHVHSPISRLPNETLAIVFEIIHEDAITVSHVNRCWRHLSLRLPILWRTVRLGLCIDQIRVYLHHSQSLSLAVTFDVDQALRGGDSSNEDCDDNEDSDDGDPHEFPKAFVARLTTLVHYVSRWGSINIDCKSSKKMHAILGYLDDLSTPRLTYASIHLRDQDMDSSLNWFVTVFSDNAPLLRTVYLRGLTLANCIFPPEAIVELEVDVREISFGFMSRELFKHMPNLRVLDVRGSILWMNGDKGHPISLPVLERFTWGSHSFHFDFSTPALRYLCLTLFRDYDLGFDMEELQDFPDAISEHPIIPAFPNVEELRYDIDLNYTADCIFVGLPSISVIHFGLNVDRGGRELCSNFFKALTDDSS
jgi:hypothetical protein